VRIDFQTLEVTPVPLELGQWTLVTLDSGERHANAGPGKGDDGEKAGYNLRRAECARACELLAIGSLREATLELAATLPPPLDGRVRHVVTENERVQRTVAALSDGDLPGVGQLLNQSHASLRDDYEISTPAVEAAVKRLLDAGAAGARIVGGGFGGHVLGLFGPGRQPPGDAIVVEPGPGAHVLHGESADGGGRGR
jgi:galactokinase